MLKSGPSSPASSARRSDAGLRALRCEQLLLFVRAGFNLPLRGVAVVVLSNNDGCCIARSQDYVESAQASNFGRPLQVKYLE